MENIAPTPMDAEPTKPAPPAPETAVAAPAAESVTAQEPETANEPVVEEAPAPEKPAAEPAAEPEPEAAAAAEPVAEPEAEDEDEDDAADDEKKKPGLYEGSGVVEGKRVRKSTERITVEAPPKKQKAVGAGTPLGDMEAVDELMRDGKNKDALEDLHRVVFKTKGAKGKVRRNLATFAGFVYGDEAKEKPRLLDRLAKFKNGQVTAMLDLCRVDRSAKSFEGKVDKDKLIGRLVAFLERPSADLQKKTAARKAPRKKKVDSDSGEEDEDEAPPPKRKRAPARKKAPPPKRAPKRAPARKARAPKQIDETLGTDPSTETYGLETLGEAQAMPLSIPVRLFAAVARAELVKNPSLDRKAVMAAVEGVTGCPLKCGEFKAVCKVLAEKAASLVVEKASEDESEAEVVPPPKRRRAAPKKRAAVESESEDEEDDEAEVMPPPRKRGAPRARKAPVVEEPEEEEAAEPAAEAAEPVAEPVAEPTPGKKLAPTEPAPAASVFSTSPNSLAVMLGDEKAAAAAAAAPTAMDNSEEAEFQ